MNILIVGSGGREHTLAWKIKQSQHCAKLYIAPGNAGTTNAGTNVPLAVDDFEGLGKFSIENDIKLIVVGPEVPLVKGLRDYFEATPSLQNIGIVGPGKAGAMLEGSKDYSKAFMNRHNIPTAQSKTFEAHQLDEALAYLETAPMPIVLKADGLAAGKGVVICNNKDEATSALRDMLVERKFGDASAKVLLEQFLNGIELSVFVLTDGQSYVVLPEAKDYKRIGDGDTGPNTGGMGAISPVVFADAQFMDKVETHVIRPTIEGLQQEGIPYQGFIFIGLMNVAGNPFVIEYNVRMGDPETQAVIPRVESDLLELLQAVANRELSGKTLSIAPSTTATVVMVAGGYPEKYEKGMVISGLDTPDPSNLVFHAGTKQDHGNTLTNGGRVIAVTGTGKDTRSAVQCAYDGVAKVNWQGVSYRNDIGQDLIALQTN